MSTNKEVRVTFRSINKTKETFSRIKQNLKQLNNQLSSVRLGFGRMGTAIVSAFGAVSIKKIIDAGAEIHGLSNKLDVSTKALSELKYAAGTCGVEFSSLTAGLEALSNNTKEAAKGAGSTYEALSLLGLSAKELSAISPDQQFARISEELMRVSDASVKAQLAMQIFGSEGAALLPLLDQGADGIKALQAEAQALGASLSGEDCAAMKKFNEELMKLQTVLTGLLTAALIPILPAITAFFTAISDGHPAITFIIAGISSLLAFRLAAWFIAASSSVRIFTASLVANPFGAVAVAISTIIAALASLYSWFKQDTVATEEYNESLTKTINLTKINLASQEKAITVASRRNELQNDAKRIFEQTRTPLERHNIEMEKLNGLLKEGLIDQDTYNRATEQTSQGFNNISDESEGLFDMISDKSRSASEDFIDNFASSIFSTSSQVKSLKETFSDFFNQLQADILKLTLKEGLFGGSGGGGGGGLLGGLFGGSGGGGSGGGLFGGVGDMFAGFFAGGGRAKAGKAHVVGDGGEPELFIPGRSGDIIPFSQLEGGGGNNANITVNMNIQTPDLDSFHYSRGQIAADMARQLGMARRNL